MPEIKNNNNTRELNTVCWAPYNFVPFFSKVLGPHDPKDDPNPSTMLTGEIKVTLTAMCPLFVGGHQEKNQDNKIFFRGADGKYRIPGSSVRGMVRSNMHILGFAALRKNEDIGEYDSKQHMFFRDVASGSSSINNDLKEYYSANVHTETVKVNESSVTVPKNVKACHILFEGGRYYMLTCPPLPVKSAIYDDGATYLRVSRQFVSHIVHDQKNCMTAEVGFKYDGKGKVTEVVPHEEIPEGGEYTTGTLLVTGRYVGGKPNSAYIIPAPNKESEYLEIGKKHILAYQVDYESRIKSMGQNASFWALPEKEGESKPFFYLGEFADTEPDCAGAKYFSRSVFPRIEYERPYSDGIPQNHVDWQKDINGYNSDYVRNILGYAAPSRALRSRVSFGDLTLSCEDVPEEKKVVLTLMNPKPSWFAGYVRNGKNYNDEDFSLRGYKKYWLKDPDTPDGAVAGKISKEYCFLSKGTKFSGIIRFKELRSDELGLLLWALRLEEDCFQSLGGGKPYGYGRIDLTIESLHCFDMDKLYDGDITGGDFEQGSAEITADKLAEQVDGYIKEYNEYATKQLNIEKSSVAFTPSVKQFFFIHKMKPMELKTGYMPLKSYGNLGTVLPTISSIMPKPENNNNAPPKNKAARGKAQGKKSSGRPSVGLAGLADALNNN